MEITQEQKMYAQVVAKAWEDAQFKSELMSNPLETIEKFTGEKLIIGQGQKFVVADQTDESTVYFNIPRKVDIDTLELTEEQLEMVAGGTWEAAGVVLGAIYAVCSAGYTLGKDIATTANARDAAAKH